MYIERGVPKAPRIDWRLNKPQSMESTKSLWYRGFDDVLRVAQLRSGQSGQRDTRDDR